MVQSSDQQMNQANENLKLVQSEELLQRFRSKLDLYKYLTQHRKSLLLDHLFL
jgi:hypothetical protein